MAKKPTNIKRTITSYKKKTVAKKDAAKVKAKSIVTGEEPAEEPPDRITNKTVSEHREEVLGGAKRFIYPLTHPKHKIAIISIALFVFIVFMVFGSTALMLYRYQRTDDFAYRVSQIVPFPVAKVDGDFVAYEDYLFEVRHNAHFRATQENINFDDEEGKAIIANLKVEALRRVKQNTLARKIAKQNGIEVAPEEVNEQIALVRQRGGIGDSDEALENTLKEFYDWSINDFERVIELQLLKQKLLPILDTVASVKIVKVQDALDDDTKFGKVVAKYSDDTLTKENGGKLGVIKRSNGDLPPQFIETAFALKVGEVSEPIQSGVGIHIIKKTAVKSENRIVISHILITFSDISDLLNAELEKVDVSDYINVAELEAEAEQGESRPQSDDLL